jgi:predicted dehydrogenase
LRDSTQVRGNVVDLVLARYLVGEAEVVGGFLRTFIPGREVDDAVEATVEFRNGDVGTIEAAKLAIGGRNAFQWKIKGTNGSVSFDMERLNELQVFRANGDRARAFRTVLVMRRTIHSGSTCGPGSHCGLARRGASEVDLKKRVNSY